MKYLTACPICLGRDHTPYLSCKDYIVSHETFKLEKCTACGFVVTNPRPDENEMSKYYESEAYISHSDKIRSLTDYVYKISRHFTLKWKYDLVQKHSFRRPISILDFGCGTGAFLQECQKNQLSICGVEPSSLARQTATKNTGTLILSDPAALKQQYDAITLWHVLEHVPDLHGTLDILRNHLSEKGTMFIAVPNLQSRDARKYQEHWAGYDVPRHLWHFSKNTMRRLIKHHQLNFVSAIPMRLDSYYVSLLSEKYKNGNNGIPSMARALLNGWKSNHAAKRTNEYSSLIYVVRK